MKHFKVIFEPDGRQISIHAGATLVEAAGQAGIILNTVCGGKGTCGKCAVEIEPEKGEVLACQYRIQSDVTVTIPPASRYFEPKILSHGIDIKTKVRREKGGEKVFGVAVDIGTTTVVAKLINMADGDCLATEAVINPQIRYGDDVISRINYAQSDDTLDELHKVIIECLNELIARLCKKASIDNKQIGEVCAVGNTTMNHIFLKLPVTQLGQAPYKAFSLEPKNIPAKELSVRINPEANIHTVANIAGFVGSDITAVALAVEMDSVQEQTLVVDIGTNGEIVLGTGNKLYAASCAAGPAFEGARISCGSRAGQGAIEAVVCNDNDIDFDVIGKGPARSICGSGLIDAVAVLLDLGLIEKSGRFVRNEKLSAPILARIIEHNGQPAFRLTEQVFLTQKDIRQVQLAKAAICAGVRLLQKKVGIEDPDIKQILLAGAFGNYIRAESALRIGLLPNVAVENIRFVGNAASSGAQMILLSHQAREKARKLAQQIEYVEIAHEKDFTDVYTECMSF